MLVSLLFLLSLVVEGDSGNGEMGIEPGPRGTTPRKYDGDGLSIVNVSFNDCQ